MNCLHCVNRYSVLLKEHFKEVIKEERARFAMKLKPGQEDLLPSQDADVADISLVLDYNGRFINPKMLKP